MSKSGGLAGFPRPEEMEAYARLSSDFIKIYLDNWTKESEHRRQLELLHAEAERAALVAEAADVAADRTERRRGQFCALTIGIVAILAGAAVAMVNRESSGHGPARSSAAVA